MLSLVSFLDFLLFQARGPFVSCWCSAFSCSKLWAPGESANEHTGAGCLRQSLCRLSVSSSTGSPRCWWRRRAIVQVVLLTPIAAWKILQNRWKWRLSQVRSLFLTVIMALWPAGKVKAAFHSFYLEAAAWRSAPSASSRQWIKPVVLKPLTPTLRNTREE